MKKRFHCRIKNKVVVLFTFFLVPLLCPIGVFAQNIAVKGQVFGEEAESIIGASVVEKGTNNATVTDINGSFSINVPPDAVLVISYLGFHPYEIPVNNKTDLRISLNENARLLDEVVVVGYGTMKKSDLTGAISSANLKDFERAPNTNIIQSLQGTVPGLNIGQVTGAGSTPSISIRGKNTISGSESVLIVLDGIIYNSSLSSINPDDIESIEILKDASSAAVYGAHAANGVLLITSKKGKKGKPRISFSSTYTTQDPSKKYRPMNRAEYLDHVRDSYYEEAYLAPDYITPNPDFDLTSKLPDAVMRDENGNISSNDYDWWGDGTQTGHIWDSRLSIAGGAEKVSYLISFGYTDQEGYLLNDSFERKNLRVNLDADPTDWWKIGVQSFGSFVNADGVQPTLGNLIEQSPLITPYDDEGNLKPYPFNNVVANPFLGTDVDDYERHNYFFANIYSEFKLPFVKGLTYRFNFGNNYRIDKDYRSSKYGAGLIGSAYKRDENYYDYTFDNIVNYDQKFGKHGISATFLYGVVERKYNYTSARAEGFDRLNLSYNNLSLGKKQEVASSAWHEALNYQMLRANYNFTGKYLLTATLRRDGFSGFAKNNKFATFPSFSLGWILSEESFFKAKWVDFLKIRGGYGVSGNQTSRYKSLSRVKSEPGYVFGDGGTPEIRQEVTSLASPNLKWEKTGGFNIGIDYSLIDQRLNGSLELYQTTTKNLLFDVAIPEITGFKTMSTNLGELSNKGIEFVITSTNIRTNDFEWSTTFNISSNTNKIKTLLGVDKDGDGKEDDLVASTLFIGKSLSAIYNYRVDGLYQLTDEIPKGFYPGNYKIVSTDDNPDITANDRVVIGKGDPAYRFGILNKLKYKDFTFSFFINSIQGGSDGYLGSNSASLARSDNTLRTNYISEYDYWSPRNPNATYARSIGSPAIVPTIYQSRSFVRLQDVNLSYQFPKKIIKSLHIEDLSLFISGKNLLIWTDWKGWDPEANSTYAGRPVLKGYSFGLNLNF